LPKIKALIIPLFALTLILQVFPLCSMAQLSISGFVTNGESNEPLVGANIVVLNTNRGTATNENGFFRLSLDVKLPVTLQVSMLGYKTITQEITKNRNNIRIELFEESIFSGEITVKAKEKEVEEKTFNRISSMELMDALTIRETPSANFYEALGHLKGVDVIMQSVQFMTVNTRGFNSTENKRFVQVVDGMDNMAPGMNFPIGNIAGLTELDVESVEFLPGPAEVQYGGNALNGTLIMKGKDPFEFQGLSLFIRPGLSDIIAGSDHPFQFIAKPHMETAVRWAKAFNKKIAFKMNASYSTGVDWFANDTTNIRPGNIKYEPDPGHDAVNKYGDEVISDLPLGSAGSSVIVSRTGYRDKDLIDNKVENLKLNGAVHYKLSDKITAILHGNYGKATTAYTGDNRISLSDFEIVQVKAEMKGEHFLIRGYTTQQNSGNSYDAKFLAVHLNERVKSNEDWFHEYYHAYKGNYRAFGVLPGLHHEARRWADRNRLLPGTPEFEEAKNEIVNNENFSAGAGIYNRSALYQYDVLTDLGKYVEKPKITVGANFRFFDLNSKGSIFPDTLGNDITVYEYGGFAQVEKAFFDEKLTAKAAIRYDKSENFEGHFSPRISALYVLNDNNNFRFSVLTGYRNPGVKEQFINKDLGTARYLGGLEQITGPYDLMLNSIYLENLNAFNESVKADMSDSQNPVGLDQAMNKNISLLEEGIVKQDQIKHLKPERVLSFEAGYKTKIANSLFLDVVYYNSVYRDFIGISKMVKPRTSPQVSLFTAAKQINKSSQSETFFVNVNAQKPVGIHGLAFGYKWLTPLGAIISGNMTFSDIRTDSSDPVAPGFNTPGFKSNLSLQNRRLDRMENNPGFRNIGFKVTWRFQNRFYWESAFGDGWVEPVSTVDVQFSVHIKKPKSILKFGASNFFNDDYTYSFGSSKIGVLYYFSLTVDNILKWND